MLVLATVRSGKGDFGTCGRGRRCGVGVRCVVNVLVTFLFTSYDRRRRRRGPTCKGVSITISMALPRPRSMGALAHTNNPCASASVGGTSLLVFSGSTGFVRHIGMRGSELIIAKAKVGFAIHLSTASR